MPSKPDRCAGCELLGLVRVEISRRPARFLPADRLHGQGFQPVWSSGWRPYGLEWRIAERGSSAGRRSVNPGLLSEKCRPEPTFSRLTAAAQMRLIKPVHRGSTWAFRLEGLRPWCRRRHGVRPRGRRERRPRDSPRRTTLTWSKCGMPVKSFGPMQINARSPNCAQAALITATVSAEAARGVLPKPK